ncbi:ABC transporter, ATP-binding protein [Synechococcus sp. PCC 7335]|uniref:ATP-binding cassette domain-containing protein n=1 Tax=Synechococcus sp. (strain ATCC 29403 / PCC 7335) TaxID=91464 RepID=UPI00017ED9D2|nr:ATP-binding cassette domain-containing protein [Synechococcus sp. PCC 7335]EDX82999.1 ABC transporter, ATP-binding protein [Synechococcus sp. PCC 7335]
MTLERLITKGLTTESDTENCAIAVHQLCKNYHQTAALKEINFSVNHSEIFGLIGPDGAGKTTAFGILAGVMESSSGEVSVLGDRPREARLNLGYVTQKFSLYPDLSIAENMRYSAGLRQVPDDAFERRAKRLLQSVDLHRFTNRLARQLSGGMKQKLALCCALIAQPKVLLLDEPTTGVDPVSRREFWDLLAAVAADGVTVVVATPYLDEAERCHRIALIYAGEIQQIGTLTELRDSLGLSRIEVRAQNLLAAEAALNERSAADRQTIVDVQTFGDRLDVMVTDADLGQQQIRAVLTRHHLPFKDMRPDAATLENVFVNRLRQQGSDPAYIQFPAYRTGQEKGAIAIATHKLQKIFGDFRAVKDFDITVRYGDIFGLLGANGAGKTTAIKMMCGLLPASGGGIQLAGKTSDLHRAEVRSRIGYMSQKFTLYDDLTILQNLDFYCGIYGVPRKLRREKIDWVLETCGLVGQEKMLTGRLPEGWKKRVAFGACVMHEPDILFLDEPTSGVDPLARRQFWRLIRDFARRGTAILVTTHYLEEAENCNDMAFMVAGEIVARGSSSEIKTQQPGQLIELTSPQTQAASDLLKARLEDWRVSIFGDRLHLVLDDPDRDLPQVRQWLQAENLTLSATRPIPFSLEDAFIGIVQRAVQRPSQRAVQQTATRK